MAVTQVDGQFRTGRIRLTGSLVRQLNRLWFTTGNLGSPQVQEDFIGQARRITSAGNRTLARATASFLRAKAAEAGEENLPRLFVGDEALEIRDLTATERKMAEEVSDLLDGLPSAEKLREPFGTVGGHLKEGASFSEASAAGRARLERLARTASQMTHVQVANTWMRSIPRAVGYRRVLGSGKNCPLCVVASTQRYHSRFLAPIHEHCGCTVSPIFGTEDPGLVVDKKRLDAVKSRLSAEGQPFTRRGMSRVDLQPEDLPTVEVVDSDIGPRLVDSQWSG